MAYDIVSLSILFQVMTKMEILEAFQAMVKILFQNAQVSVCVNGAQTDAFYIKWEERHTCSLAPYFFLFIGKSLNSFSKTALAYGAIQGIRLPNIAGQQLMVHYADDTNYTLQNASKSSTILRLLKQFYLTSRLEIK